MAGLPAGDPDDRTPNWIVYPFPPRNLEVLQWQWNERLVPYWQEHGKIAEEHGVRLCFEIHPADMVFQPSALLRLREAIGPVAGANLDPSHLIWQGMDIRDVILSLGDAIYHVHAKDTKIDPDKLYEVGVMGLGWNTPKIPGFGDVHWGKFFSTLSDIGYNGPVCIEVEDRAFEDSLEGRKRSLRQSKKYLEQFIS